MANKTLQKARKNKSDEFYTQLADIETKLKHYKDHFKGKTVLCNCDDPRVHSVHETQSVRKTTRQMPPV